MPTTPLISDLPPPPLTITPLLLLLLPLPLLTDDSPVIEHFVVVVADTVITASGVGGGDGSDFMTVAVGELRIDRVADMDE
jgi:hypothetical protein